MKPPLKMILALLLEATTLRIVTGTGCLFPLGMASRVITDDQLLASSSRDDGWLPKYARLNNDRAWSPRTNSKSEWLQIDLRERKVISRIQTQGLPTGWWLFQTLHYVSSFKLSSSDDEMNWITFQENGSDKVFVGNRNANSMQDNGINPPIRARFIRLMAETWNNNIAFRLELLGCEIEGTTTQISSSTTTTTTTSSTTNVATTSAITTTQQQTTRSTPVNTYPMSYTRSTPVTMEGITSVVPQRSTSSAISRPGTRSSSSNNTSGNSDGLAGNQTATPSVAIIGGAVAAGVVVIIAIIVSIFLIRRRRSKPRDGKETSTQADEGTVDNIYYGGVAFAANGNASTNGNVSIGQSEGMVDNQLYAYSGPTNGNSSSTDQSEGIVDNHLYAGTSTTNGTLPFDQSEGTVDNHLYAGTGDACLETREYDSAQDSVYYNVAHTSDEGVVENDIYC